MRPQRLLCVWDGWGPATLSHGDAQPQDSRVCAERFVLEARAGACALLSPPWSTGLTGMIFTQAAPCNPPLSSHCGEPPCWALYASPHRLWQHPSEVGLVSIFMVSAALYLIWLLARRIWEDASGHRSKTVRSWEVQSPFLSRRGDPCTPQERGKVVD